MRSRFVLLLAASVVSTSCSSGGPASTTAADAPAASSAASPPPPPVTLPAATAQPGATQPPAVTPVPVTTTVPLTTAPAPPQAGTTRRTVEVAGRERRYVLHIPGSLEAGPVPLVIDFHGLTATPDREESISGMRRKADAEGFLVAQPAAGLVGNAWDTLEGSDDVEFARAIVEDVSRHALLDRSRIYAVGFSAGGGMADRVACDAADLVAAVGVVAGAHFGWRRCAPERAVPIIAFHGDEDIVVPIEGFGLLLPGITEWAEQRAARAGCQPEPIDSRPADDVARHMWGGCDLGALVVLYVIDGGGHGWPGTPDSSRVGDTTDSIVATDLIWDFFATYTLP